MSIRRRARPFSGPAWRVVTRSVPVAAPDNPSTTDDRAPAWAPSYLQGTQVTESVSHPGYRRIKNGENLGDVGGPFSTRDRTASLIGGDAHFGLSGRSPNGSIDRTLKYDGRLVSTGVALAWPPFAESSDSELTQWGTSAIARCRPTNIFVDLSTSLAEFLREGLPKFAIHGWDTLTDAVADAAGGHLALQFGASPLVGDFYKSLETIIKADTVIKQYARDSGRLVRRRYEEPVKETRETSVFRAGVEPYTSYSDFLTSAAFSVGDVIRTRVTSRRRWFAGAFTYHLPWDDSLGEIEKAAFLAKKDLLSLKVSPETFWNVLPWSWAVDWFVPVGDVISNLQSHSKDGLVMRYGYVMEHSSCTDTYTWVGAKKPPVPPGSIVLKSECKKRIQANPFGFGLSWDGLSPFQWSIVTALGISRGTGR